MDEMENVDFDVICRICLKECEASDNLYSECKCLDSVDDEKCYDEMLLACTLVCYSPNDGLPSQICEGCIRELNAAYVFSMKCEKSDWILRQLNGCKRNGKKRKRLKSESEKRFVKRNLIKIKREIIEESKTGDVDEIKTEDFDDDTEMDGNADDIEIINIENEIEIEDDDKIIEDDDNDNNYEIEEIESDSKIENVTDELKSDDEPSTNDIKTEEIEDDESFSANDKEVSRSHKYIRRGVPFCQNCDILFASDDVKDINYCPACNQKLLRNTFKTKRNMTDTYKKFSCSVCKKKFGNKFNLKRHIMLHTGLRPYKCEICGKNYIQLTSLKEHIRIHTGEMPYICDLCGRRFMYQALLNYHRTRHAIENGGEIVNNDIEIPQYPCDHCDKVYNSKTALNAHKLAIKGKQFLCSYCGRGYTAQSTLKVHMKSHTGTRPHVCDICNKSFTNPGALRKHKRIHTGDRPYTCNECGKGFKQSSQLMYHTKTHTKERPHQCNICDKTFTLKGTLTVHMRTHTGEQPYRCEKCNLNFPDSKKLKKHEILHGDVEYTEEITQVHIITEN